MEIPEEYKGPIAYPDDDAFSEVVLKYLNQTFSQKAIRRRNSRMIKCSLTFDSFLYWVGLNYHQISSQLQIYSDIYIVFLNKGELSINYNASKRQIYNEKILQAMENNPILMLNSEEDFEPYGDLNYCRTQAMQLLENNPYLEDLFLGENSFDQTEILEFLYELSINISFDRAPSGNEIVSKVEFSHKPQYNSIILSLNFTDYSTEEALLLLNDNIYFKNRLEDKIIETTEYAAIFNPFPMIDFNITAIELTIIFTFNVKVWTIEQYYNPDNLGGWLTKLDALCREGSRFSRDNLLSWAREWKVKTKGKSDKEICSEFRKKLIKGR